MAKRSKIWMPDIERVMDDMDLGALGPGKPATAAHAVITTMDTVSAKAVEWLWWPYMARGTIVMLDGDPGIGKSIFTLQLASAISQGWTLPDQQGKPTFPTGRPGHVLLLAAEDSAAHTIRPRIDQAGGNPALIHKLEGWMEPGKEDLQYFTLKHLPLLARQLDAVPYVLIIIDPIQAYLGDIDMHRANETRPLMTGLKDLAERYNCTIVCVRHPSKDASSRKALYRGLGSVDLVGAARSALFAEEYPGDRNRVMLLHYKSNQEILGRTQVYSKAQGHFSWAGVSRLNAEDVAGSGRGPDTMELLRAAVWLETFLTPGIPMPSLDIFLAAEDQDIAKKTLARAKRLIGINVRKQREQWFWELPPLLLGSLSPLGPLGSLGPLGLLQQTQGVTQESQEYQEGQQNQEGQESQELLTRAPVIRAPDFTREDVQHSGHAPDEEYGDDTVDDLPF